MSFVPLFVVFPASFTGVPELVPELVEPLLPHPVTTTVTEASRITILRMSEHTDRSDEGIAPRRGQGRPQ